MFCDGTATAFYRIQFPDEGCTMRMQWTVVFALLATIGCGSKKDPGTGGNGADDMAVPCGNGVVDNGEDCDEGVNNGLAGGRCNSYCQFVCAVDANCDDS